MSSSDRRKTSKSDNQENKIHLQYAQLDRKLSEDELERVLAYHTELCKQDSSGTLKWIFEDPLGFIKHALQQTTH